MSVVTFPGEVALSELIDWPAPASQWPATRRRQSPPVGAQDFGIDPAPPTPAVMSDEARHWVAYAVLNGNIISRNCACQWGICEACDQGHHDQCLTRQLRHGQQPGTVTSDGARHIPETTVAFWRLGAPVSGVSAASRRAGPALLWLGCRYQCPCHCPKTPPAPSVPHIQLDLFPIEAVEG